MSTLLTSPRETRRFREPGRDAPSQPRLFGDAPAGQPAAPSSADPRRPTLEDVVSGAWDALLNGEPTACPVCGGRLEPRYSAGAGVVGGRCSSCGSTLG